MGGMAVLAGLARPMTITATHPQPCTPRRFPRCYSTDYRQRIAYEDEDLLVVEKPAGCPCSLHVSNALEVCGDARG